jgi:hypothetical protein
MLRPAVKAGADVVYGSRFLANPRPTGMKTANFIANRMLSVTANLLYGMAITDEATCFKLLRTERPARARPAPAPASSSAPR